MQKLLTPRIIFAVFTMLATFAIPVFFLKNGKQWLYIFDKSILYYALWIIFIIFAINLYRHFEEQFSKTSFRQTLAKTLPSLIISAVIAVIAVSAVESKFRALSDETILVDVSQKMYLDQEAVRCTEGELTYGKLECRTYSHEIRNPFFPFLLTLGHSVLGFDSKNGFIVNNIIGFLLLWLLFLTVEMHLNRKIAIGSILLLASYPIFLQNINASTYDAANLFFTLLSFYFLSLLAFKKKRLYLELFMLSAALTASTRYEGALVALAGLPVLISFIRHHPNFRLRDWLYYPLYFIPAEIHVLLFIKDDHQSGDIATFSGQHFWKNLTDNISMLADWDKLQVMSPIVFYLAIVGFFIFIFRLFTRKIDTTPILAATFLFFLMPFLVIHFYYAGTFSLNINTRICLIFLPFIAILASYFINQLHGFRYGNILAAFLFLFMLAPANADSVHKSMYLPNERQNLVDYFDQKSNNERPLIFYSRPDFFILENFSSLYYTTMLENRPMLYDYVKERKYDHYYYVRGLDCRREKAEEGKLLKEIYQKNICDEVERTFPFIEEKLFHMDKGFPLIVYRLDEAEFLQRYEEETRDKTGK